ARRRLERLITTLESLTPERLQAIRAVEALELIRTAAARRLLRQLADGGREARLTREARESLNRLEGEKGLARSRAALAVRCPPRQRFSDNANVSQDAAE